jgi:hypothetical protein
MTENQKTIYSKIIEFQKIMKPIKKSTTNPFYKSKYADLASIQECIKDDLCKCNLGYIQITEENGLKTILFDGTGEKIEFTYPCNLTGKAQEIGSSITYAKRYSLVALLGLIVEDDDDDGNEAQNQTVSTANTVTWLTKEQFEKTFKAEKSQIQYVLKQYSTDTHKMKKEYREQLEELTNLM